MTPAIWLNILFLMIALLVAFVYLRRDHLREKSREDELKSITRYTKTAEFKRRKSYAAQYREIVDQTGAFPSLDRDGFELADVALESIDAPPDIALPPLSVKRTIQPGDQVLVCIVWNDDTPACDAWVQVTEVLPDDLFAGSIIAVASDEGERINGRDMTFSANHIAVIERPLLRPKPN